MGSKFMTDEEKDFITNEALRGVSCKDIAIKLGRHYSAVKRFLNKNELPSNPPRRSAIPLEDCGDIYDLYNSGLTIQEIHDSHYPQYKTDAINYVLRREGITRQNGRQVVLDHGYFHSIDCEEKAYFLGLLCADGSVRHCAEKGENSYTITLDLQEEDKYLVEALRDAVKSDREVKTYINHSGFQRKDGKPHTTSKIVFSSKQMALDLISHGVVPNKSSRLCDLPQIEDKYMRHFIRGYIDGNGSVTTHYNKSLRVLIYSTHEFCDKINHYLHMSLGTAENKVVDQKSYDVSFITFSKHSDLVSMYDYLYEDATIYMKRKKEKFEPYISEYRGK